MRTERRTTSAPSAWPIWRRNGIVWLVLVALLLITYRVSYVPLGIWNTPVALAIAFTQAGLVLLLYMEAKESSPLIRLAAVTGFLFLFVLFMLTATDVVARVLAGWRA